MAHRSLPIIYFGCFEMISERLQRMVETPGFERVLLRLHPGSLCGGVRRNRLGGGAQVLADMIKINQVAALEAKLLLHLADDPWRAVPDRVNAGIRAEAGPNRACEELPSGDFGPALDRARENRRFAALGVRQANLRLSPKDSLAFAFVLLAGVRLDHGDHAAVRLSDNIFGWPGASGKTAETRLASKMLSAWPSAILCIGLSPISKP